MSEDTLAQAEEVHANEARLPMLWVVFTVAIAIYAVLAYVLDSGPVAVDRTLRNWILLFVAMTAGLHVLVVLLLKQLMAALSRARYFNYCILRWALIEAIAVYGLILGFLGVGIGITAFFFATAILLLGASRSGPADRALFVAQFR